MQRKHIAFIAIAITILFGATMGSLNNAEEAQRITAPIGSAIVVIAWIAVGVFGKSTPKSSEDSKAVDKNDE